MNRQPHRFATTALALALAACSGPGEEPAALVTDTITDATFGCISDMKPETKKVLT
jgi:hypothetical protein